MFRVIALGMFSLGMLGFRVIALGMFSLGMLGFRMICAVLSASCLAPDGPKSDHGHESKTHGPCELLHVAVSNFKTR